VLPGVVLSTGFSLVGGLSLVGGRFALGGRSGSGVSGAGVGCVELHMDCDRDRMDGGREFAVAICGISGISSGSSPIEFLLDFKEVFEGCECRARARRSEAVDFIACTRGADTGGVTGNDSIDGGIIGLGVARGVSCAVCC